MKTDHYTADKARTVYRGLKALVSDDKDGFHPTGEEYDAIRDFVEFLGKTSIDEGLTVETDEEHANRKAMGVKCERKGRRLLITVYDYPDKP